MTKEEYIRKLEVELPNRVRSMSQAEKLRVLDAFKGGLKKLIKNKT